MRKKWLFNILCIVIDMLAMSSVPVAYVVGKEMTADKILTPYVYEIGCIPQAESNRIEEKKRMEAKESEQAAVVGVEVYPGFSYSREWSSEDQYLLAKIAMTEAEGASIQCKTLVIIYRFWILRKRSVQKKLQNWNRQFPAGKRNYPIFFISR